MPGLRELVLFLGRRDRHLSLSVGNAEISFTTPDGKSISTQSIEEAASLLEPILAPISWRLMAEAPKSTERDGAASLRIHIDHSYTGALISVTADDLDLLDAVYGQIERSFGFQHMPPGINRIRKAPHATALIGCHFDEPSKKSAQRLQKFLSLIGFAQVEIADTVRASPIQDKVSELLDRNAFYIGIVTGQRDHAWISAESAYAIAKNKEVILIIQNNTVFNPTFYGRDREHLTYTNIIDETFIGLLEDFQSRAVLGLR